MALKSKYVNGTKVADLTGISPDSVALANAIAALTGKVDKSSIGVAGTGGVAGYDSTETKLAGKVAADSLVVNVKRFNPPMSSVGNIVDCSLQVQQAINAAAVQITGPNNLGRGAIVELPAGWYSFNVILATGVKVRGHGNATYCTPFFDGVSVFSAPQGNLHWSGVEDLMLYGNGASSRVTPYTVGGIHGKAYRLTLSLSSALVSGATYTSITVPSVTTANTIPVNAVLTIGIGTASVQQVKVTTATTLSTSGTTTIPVTSFVANAAYASALSVEVTGGFSHGIYLPRGTGGAGTSTTSGTWECSWKNLRIENFGNNGFHAEGGSIYQAQQFSTYEQVHIEYCQESGYYADGFVQNNAYNRLVCRNNKSHNMVHQAWLSGSTWNTPNDNGFRSCIFESSGNYISGGTLTAAVATTSGVYTEGNYNVYDDCWWELNGLGEPSGDHLSVGIMLNYVPTGTAGNVIVNCHFDDHFTDIYCYEGSRNVIENNRLLWDSTRPASKFSYVRIKQASAAPVIKPNHYNVTSIPFIYIDSGTPLTAILMERNGAWSLGTVPGNIVSGAMLTIDGGHIAFKTDNAYDIGTASNRPRHGRFAGTVTAGSDIEITDSTKGYIAKSPDGTRYRITVANGGALVTTAV